MTAVSKASLSLLLVLLALFALQRPAINSEASERARAHIWQAIYRPRVTRRHRRRRSMSHRRRDDFIQKSHLVARGRVCAALRFAVIVCSLASLRAHHSFSLRLRNNAACSRAARGHRSRNRAFSHARSQSGTLRKVIATTVGSDNQISVS